MRQVGTHHPPIDDSKPTPQAYGVPDEPPKNVMSPYDNSPFEHRDSPASVYPPPTPIPDNTPPPPQLEHNQYDTTNKYDEHVVPFNGRGTTPHAHATCLDTSCFAPTRPAHTTSSSRNLN